MRCAAGPRSSRSVIRDETPLRPRTHRGGRLDLHLALGAALARPVAVGAAEAEALRLLAVGEHVGLEPQPLQVADLAARRGRRRRRRGRAARGSCSRTACRRARSIIDTWYCGSRAHRVDAGPSPRAPRPTGAARPRGGATTRCTAGCSARTAGRRSRLNTGIVYQAFAPGACSPRKSYGERLVQLGRELGLGAHELVVDRHRVGDEARAAARARRRGRTGRRGRSRRSGTGTRRRRSRCRAPSGRRWRVPWSVTSPSRWPLAFCGHGAPRCVPMPQ